METVQHTSRGARLVKRFLRRGWQWIIIGVLALALGVAAFLSPGLVRADVHLDEGIVYAVKRDVGLVGTVNTQIEELTAATGVGDSQSAILQYEDLVLVHGQESNTLTEYLPARNRLDSPMTLPTNATVQLVGSQLLINSPQNGRVWFGDAVDVLKMDLQKDKAHFEVGQNGIATLTASGTVIGLDVNESHLLREVDGETVTTALPFKIDAQRLGGIELSAVGDKAVVLDRSAGLVWVEGMQQAFDVSGATSAKLLPPSRKAFGGKEDVKAVYATEAGLIGVTPDGPRSLSGQMGAAPIAPVQLGECIYGVFGDRFVKRCPDEEPLIRDIPGYDGTSTQTLTFHVNRRTVALNEAVSGVVWLVDQNMARIDRWDDLIPDKNNEPPPPDSPLTPQPPDRSEENRPPIAQDDTLTARRGRATLLKILDNDSDPDGDILTIKAPSEIGGASLQIVRDGAGLQITIPPETDASTLTFSYTISDGFFEDTANVTVNVADPDPAKENKAPYPFELATPMAVQLGGSFTKRLLLDWRDPEGDPLILENASLPPGSEDLVTFTPDGTIQYQDVGKTAGQKKINVTVSDGFTETHGELVVNVVEDIVPPIAHGDFETVRTGQTVVVRPMDNDIGQNLSLTEVDAGDCQQCTVSKNFSEGWFSFSATATGTYYLTYNVSNGPVSMGVVRIDVVDPGTNNPPVAALDVALLPPGGKVVVDPLLNDTDLDGDVLVVQSFTADPSLRVVMERRHLMTISANSHPEAPVTVEYVVSDGRHTARGTIVVIPTKNTGSVEPSAVNDDVRVRAGSVGTVPVLENDTSPIGLDLSVTRLLDNPLGDNAWVDGNNVRVRIPDGSLAQQLAIAYEVTDTEGNLASAVVNVTVVSADAANEAPTPKDIEDRVLAGSSALVPIRLDGIDPNGDAVRLVGLGSGPKLGRVTNVGDTYLTYEAFPSSQGTDTFHYEVVDAHGATATGQISIGVAPPGDVNRAPIGVHDVVHVRPNRPIQIAATANDYDIEGDSFGYSADKPVKMDDPTKHAEIINDREIVVDPIAEPGTYTGTYRLEDTRQQLGFGTFAVVVDEDAPLLPPQARDDMITVGQILDKDLIDVDVTANDYDPDGPQEELKVSLPGIDPEDEDAPRITQGGKLSIPITSTMQQVRYQLTDGDGLTSFGVVTVPGNDDAIPLVRDTSRTLEATAGLPAHISFADLLVGTQGREVKLTSTDTITATTGGAVPATGGIEFTPHADYTGPAAVVFEVVDVVPEGDQSAKRAYVSIPFQVKPAGGTTTGEDKRTNANQPPEQLQQPHLLVGPDEGEFRLALSPLFRDPEGQDFNFLSFQETGGDAPITWRTEANNSVIVATAPIDARPGMVKTLRGEVKDAVGGSRPVDVVLEMTSSTRPLTTTVTDVVDEAQAGFPIPIPVTANDTSHLNDPTLTVESARILSGSGTIEVQDNIVTVTPDEEFVGTMSAVYTVMDATGDPARRQDGNIRLTVSNRPSPPSAPFGGVPGDGSIRFEYRPGSTNGHPVERRVVTATSPGLGSVEQECPGTTCTITGLRNNVPWTLTMVEINKLGPSDPSPESAPYTPDVIPLAPEKPITTRGDKELTVAWEAPKFANEDNAGSPVTEYTLKIFDSSGTEIGSRQLPGNSLEYTWTGLQNGQSYTFSVSATNNAGESPASERSTAMFPVGPPKGSVSIKPTPLNDGQGGSFAVEVNTSGLDNGGDPDMKVRIIPIAGGSSREADAQSIAYPAPATTSTTFNGWGLTPMRFKVVAENLHSSAEVGETSQEIIAWPTPSVTVRSAEGSQRYPLGILMQLASPEVSDPGLAGLTFQYSTDGSSWRDMTRIDGDVYGTAQNFTAGTTVNLSVRAVLKNSASERISAPERVSAMPVSEKPHKQELSQLTAMTPDEVKVSIESQPGPRSSGGWTKGRYVLHTGSEPHLSNEVWLRGGGERLVYQGFLGSAPDNTEWSDEQLYRHNVTVKDIWTTKKSGDNFVITVNYAYGGSVCRVYDSDKGNRNKIDEATPNSEGVIHLNKAYEVTPGTGDTPPEYRQSVYVECVINGNGGDDWQRTIQ